jgi:hypothetical protein
MPSDADLVAAAAKQCKAPDKFKQLKPSENGCGPATGKVLNKFLKAFVPEFKACCNTHDKCFGKLLLFKHDASQIALNRKLRRDV